MRKGIQSALEQEINSLESVDRVLFIVTSVFKALEHQENKVYFEQSMNLLLIGLFLLFNYNNVKARDSQVIFSALSLPFSSNNFPSSNGGMRPARPVSWTDCGTPDDLFRLEGITLSPDPPRRSAPLTVNVKGYLREQLDEGVVEYEVKFGGFKLATGSLDGCPALKEEPALPQCPVQPGPINVTHTVQLPWHIPPGKYLINAKGKRSADGKQIFCVDLDVAVDVISETDMAR